MKTLSLPDKVSDELSKTAQELSLMAKKPFSESMAIDLLIEVYHAHLSNPCALDGFSQQLQSLNIMTPAEFDKYWDTPDKQQTPKRKTNPKKQ
jgi:hypothetical protein